MGVNLQLYRVEFIFLVIHSTSSFHRLTRTRATRAVVKFHEAQKSTGMGKRNKERKKVEKKTTKKTIANLFDTQYVQMNEYTSTGSLAHVLFFLSFFTIQLCAIIFLCFTFYLNTVHWYRMYREWTSFAQILIQIRYSRVKFFYTVKIGRQKRNSQMVFKTKIHKPIHPPDWIDIGCIQSMMVYNTISFKYFRRINQLHVFLNVT